jgi:cell division protease FtsH
VASVIATVFERTLDVLRANREVLERTARELLAQETLDEDALKRLVVDLKRPDETVRPSIHARIRSAASGKRNTDD